jgi:hypothetical protein
MKLYLHSAPSPWRNILSKDKGNVVSFARRERSGGVEGQRHLFEASALALPRGNSPRYPLNKRLGGPQGLSGLSEQQ